MSERQAERRQLDAHSFARVLSRTYSVRRKMIGLGSGSDLNSVRAAGAMPRETEGGGQQQHKGAKREKEREGERMAWVGMFLLIWPAKGEFIRRPTCSLGRSARSERAR